MGVMRISAHSLTSDVGIGSRPQNLDGYADENYLTVLSGKQNNFNRIWDKWGIALEEITSY